MVEPRRFDTASRTHICMTAIYEHTHRRTLLEKRHSGTARPRPARGGAAAWLRHCHTHRAAFERRGGVQRRVAVTDSLSPRSAGQHLGLVGRTRRPAAPPLLQAHRRRAQEADTAARDVERVHGRRPARGGFGGMPFVRIYRPLRCRGRCVEVEGSGYGKAPWLLRTTRYA